MTISNWKISTVTNIGKRWKITAAYESSPSESAARDFFNGLFGGNTNNYLSLNGLDYKYINFKIQSAGVVDLFVHMDDRDYDWFPSFIDWSDWTFDGVDVWTAAVGSQTIAVGTGTPLTAGPFGSASYTFAWSSSAPCTAGATTTTLGVAESGSMSDAIKHSIILSIFNVNNYLRIDGVQYQIAAAPTVSGGGGVITIYNRSGANPCAGAGVISPILKGEYMEPVGSDNVFDEIFLQNVIPSGNLKIFYDFKSFSFNPHVQSISPVSSGTWSGAIFGNPATFSGTRTGYGCFERESYVKIAHADELYSDNWTMMFASTRKDNKPSTIFSNFGGYTNPTSGFALGFNSANRLYFHNYEYLRPNIYTHLSHNANENIFCVIGQSDSIQVGRYDLGIKGFDFEETSINSNFFRQSDDWYLGTGTAIGIDNYNYDGCLDYFLYFNRSLGVEQANSIASGMYSAITGVAPITRIIPGTVTGYTETITGKTGTIGYSSTLSGQRATAYTGYAVTGKNLMGNVTTTGVSNLYITGDNYTGFYIKPDTWPPGTTTYKELRSYTGFYSGNHPFLQKFNQETLFSGVDVLSITGMQTGLSGYQYTGYENVYTGAPVTGYLYSGYDYDPLTGDPTVMVLKPSGNTFIPTTKIYNYFFDAVSYLGLRGNTNGSGDAVDYSYWNHGTSTASWINLGWSLNYNQDAGWASLCPELERSTFSLANAESGQINLYFNGISQDQGQLQINTDSLYNKTYTTISGDYSLISETTKIHYVNDNATGLSGFGSRRQGEDQVLYDISQPLTNRQRTGISNTSQWASPSALGISGDNVQAFLNGIKIYSGVDYTSVGGYLSATGPITNVTGYLSTFPALATGDWLNQTGVNLYDITGIFISENIYYLNGVRQPPQQFLLYPSGVSLITGVNHLLEGPLDLLYYRNTDYGD